MSTPIETKAVVRCGKQTCTHAIHIPVGERRRPERRPFVEGYVEARGWTIYRPGILSGAELALAWSGSASNDWRCPEHANQAADA